MNKLISMVDFVLQFGKEENRYNYEQAYDKISAYANFLKQPLTLGMFVPCDLYWNVLTKNTMSEDTCEDDCDHYNCVKEMNQCISYQEAKSKILFEGFRLDGKYMWHEVNLFMISDNIKESFENRTIEFLFSCYKSAEIVLTESANKQIGL